MDAFLPAEALVVTNLVRHDHLLWVHYSVLIGVEPWAREFHFWAVVITLVIFADDSVMNILAVITLEVTLLVAKPSFDWAVLVRSSELLVEFHGTHLWEASFGMAIHGADNWLIIVSTRLDALRWVVLAAIFNGPKFSAVSIIALLSTNIRFHVVSLGSRRGSGSTGGISRSSVSVVLSNLQKLFLLSF